MLPSRLEAEAISISGTRERTAAGHDGTHFDLDRHLAGVDVGLLDGCWYSSVQLYMRMRTCTFVSKYALEVAFSFQPLAMTSVVSDAACSK